MVEPTKFEYIKRTLAIGVIDNMMKQKGWSEDDAIRRFMCSEVYDGLRREETKVWHFSVNQLTCLYEDELNGVMVWPEQP
jgi:hypothetical protein